MASSRYPNKPLVEIAGLPLLEHVRRRVLLSGVDLVVVATCDREIRDAIESEGGEVAMTSPAHERCTDRVAEAMTTVKGDTVAIVQGDEPLVIPAAITQVVQPLLDGGDLQCTNLLSPLTSEADRTNSDIVKAACNQMGDIIYMSRASIPFIRNAGDVPVYRQTGIMGFRTSLLHQYSALVETPIERAESIDMMRVIEHGIRIRGVIAEYSTVGVDRPSDVALVERALREDPVQRELHAMVLAMTGRGH